MRRFEVENELVINCYEDLKTIPGFTPGVAAETLKDIRKLKAYSMPKQIQCGIVECHRWHNDGCAIERPDGVVTNIGHCCAEIYLGADAWRLAKNQFRDRSNLASEKRDINTFLDDHRAFIREAFTAWYDRDVRWLDWTRRHFMEGAPDVLRDALFKRALKGVTLVTQTRKRDGKDWTAHLGYSSQDSDSDVVTIPIGNLAGLSSLKVCAHDLVYEEVFLRAQQLLQQNLSGMTNADIKRYVAKIKAFPRRLDRAAELVAEGKVFFTAANFALFAPLLEQDCREGTSRALEHYEWDFALSKWVVSPKLGLVRKPVRAA